MSRVIKTDVVVIGGGPVGLTAVTDLNARGVHSAVVERRVFLNASAVKSNHVSSRTMERFRLLGVAQKIREAGLPGDYPNDISFRTSMTGYEMSRVVIPCRNDRYTSKDGADTSWETPEPAHRVNQRYLEPVLMSHVETLPNVELFYETEYLSSHQDEDGVTVLCRDAEGEFEIQAKYLIGADGARSQVRKEIGSQLEGDPVLSNVQSTLIRSEKLYDLMPGKPAWAYYSFNPQRSGHVFAIDGVAEFLIHNYLDESENSGDEPDRDASIRAILGVDDEFEYEQLSVQDWVARRLVANRTRKGRIFLAGDASHTWVPYAGYGMNAGVADVLNLTWLLGAALSGWAGENILDAYEEERLPIVEQVSHFVMAHQKKIVQADVPANIEADDAAGEAAREKLGREAYELNVQQFAAEGLNFGYSYDGSPIIIYDGEKPPAYSMSSYTPSTVPGCRAPHFWLSDGGSLYDALGLYYSVIAVGESADCSQLIEEAAKVGFPIVEIKADQSIVPSAYTKKFTIVRQDQHVAWRGDDLPEDLPAFFKKLSAN